MSKSLKVIFSLYILSWLLLAVVACVDLSRSLSPCVSGFTPAAVATATLDIHRLTPRLPINITKP